MVWIEIWIEIDLLEIPKLSVKRLLGSVGVTQFDNEVYDALAKTTKVLVSEIPP